MGRKSASPSLCGSWVPIEVARTEAYLHAKFHLDPSNRLDTVHERDRQDRQDRQRTDSIGRTVLQTVAQKARHANMEQELSSS